MRQLPLAETGVAPRRAPASTPRNGKGDTAEPRSSRIGGVQSVERALRLLDIIAVCGGEANLTKLSELSGLNISTCHHLLATLLDAGYVAKPHGKRTYVLGSRILFLSTACMKQVHLPRRAQRMMDYLNLRTREAVQIAVLQGDDLITVLRKEALHAVRVDAGPMGKVDAAHATATGKAILAWLPEVELNRIIEKKGLRAFTAHTITDRDTLIEDLRLVRRHGFAMDREEFQPGVICIGAAIRGHDGTVVGSLSVSCPAFRAEETLVADIREQVMVVAASLSADLDHEVTDLESAAAPLDSDRDATTPGPETPQPREEKPCTPIWE